MVEEVANDIQFLEICVQPHRTRDQRCTVLSTTATHTYG